MDLTYTEVYCICAYVYIYISTHVFLYVYMYTYVCIWIYTHLCDHIVLMTCNGLTFLHVTSSSKNQSLNRSESAVGWFSKVGAGLFPFLNAAGGVSSLVGCTRNRCKIDGQGKYKNYMCFSTNQIWDKILAKLTYIRIVQYIQCMSIVAPVA